MNKKNCILLIMVFIACCFNANAGYSAPVVKDKMSQDEGGVNTDNSVEFVCQYCHEKIGDDFGKQCSKRKEGFSHAPKIDSEGKYKVTKCLYCGQETIFSNGEKCPHRKSGYSHAPVKDPKGIYKEKVEKASNSFGHSDLSNSFDVEEENPYKDILNTDDDLIKLGKGIFFDVNKLIKVLKKNPEFVQRFLAAIK